ncbi:MAG: PVC-type heme-binding CxxCH protein [Chryseosolibacter sp.]
MLKNIILICLFTVFVRCSRNDTAVEQPLLYTPDDLEATLWAESPMFFNPTNVDVDYRGRIWITEAVNYRNFNNDSTKALHHQKGDRVMILEDTDGDGKADASKVFVQDKDLVSPLGIAVIGNKVYVSCSPNLIVYTDEDGDDVPDHKEILLTGFGGLDHDHSLHAVLGGMDGNLYFNTGNAGPHVVTDKSGWTLRAGSIYTGGTPYNTRNQGNMKSDDGKVWVGGLALRMNAEGEHLKVMAHNFRNAYELTVDSRGDMWQNDNDDQVVACRTSWLMEGGNAGYFSTDGTRYWQADQRPWQDVFSAHWHQDDPGVMPAGDNAGAGSPTGVVLNEGDGLGPEYRGMLLSADAGRNVVFGYHPRKQRSGYDLGKRRNFITSLREDNAGYVWNDSAGNAQSEKWFRPSDVTIGTDGALYVADWYDPVVGGHQMQDTVGYGRIYRIAPKGKKLSRPDINLSTRSGQLDALRSPAINVRYTALLKLKTAGPSIIDDVRQLLEDENPYHRARAVWLLSQLGDEGVQEVRKLLDHGNEDIRLVAYRALRQALPEEVVTISGKLASDPSDMIRREVTIGLTGTPFAGSKDIMMQLIDAYDGKDRWYLEALGKALEGHESRIFPEILKKFNPEGKRADAWDEKLASLVWRLHPVEAVNDLRIRAASPSLHEQERSKAITALAFISKPEAVRAMIALSKEKDERIAEQATYWLTFRQGNEWYALWDWDKTGIDLEYERTVAQMKIKRSRVLDEQMPLNERKWNARDMAKDPVGGQMILGLLADDQLPQVLYPVVEETLLKNANPAVQMRAVGFFRRADADKSFSIPGVLALKGNRRGGESIFKKSCASCHRVKGHGQAIGPDLTYIHDKFDRRALLDAIIFPDTAVVFGYEAWTINLTDGQSYFGFLIADGAQTVTIKDLTGKNHTILTKEIRSRKKQEGSLMPIPQQLGLTAQDLADVTEFLVEGRD